MHSIQRQRQIKCEYRYDRSVCQYDGRKRIMEIRAKDSRISKRCFPFAIFLSIKETFSMVHFFNFAFN